MEITVQSDQKWLELRPYPSFEDKWHFKQILTKVDSFAIFFIRRKSKTHVLVRTNNAEQVLFRKLEQVESSEIEKTPDFIMPYIKKVTLRQKNVLPVIQNIDKPEHGNLFQTLEQILDDCIIAVYVKRDNSISSTLYNWVLKKEAVPKTKDAPKTTISPYRRNKIDQVKSKAKESDFFVTEVYFGANNKETFNKLVFSLPKPLSLLKTVAQKRFVLKQFKNVFIPFPFVWHEPKKGILKNNIFLSAPELLTIISFPENVSKLSLYFGKQETFTHGPSVSIESTGLFDEKIDGKDKEGSKDDNGNRNNKNKAQDFDF